MFDIYCEKIWDYVVGWVVVIEVGGCVIDVCGNDFDFFFGCMFDMNWGVIVINGLLYDEVFGVVCVVFEG